MIPTVDISSFIQNTDAEAKKACADVIYKAATGTGFFLISGFEEILPRAVLARMFESLNEFFTLPLEEKRKIKASELRGYFALGEENLSTVHTQLNEDLEHKELGDYKEGIDFGREVDDWEVGLPFRRKNEFPVSLGPEWKERTLDYFGRCTKLAHILCRIFATALDLEENWFENKIDRPQSALRLLHYPPVAAKEQRFGCGAHSDYGCCTILAQDKVGGLQLLNADGQWVDIPCNKDTLVVNIGDMMQRWTNDTFKSTIHRVINSSGKHRFSIPFFFDPNFDVEVACIETCQKENIKYPPIKFGDHLSDMFKATFVQPTKVAAA